MNKKLKFWNGNGHGIWEKHNINVAAYSQKQAAELVGQACKRHITIGEIQSYYSPCWGNSMDDIQVTGPCVYVERNQPRMDPKKII